MYKEYYNYPHDNNLEACFEFQDGKNINIEINNYLKKTNGLALEVGGPTEKGYRLLHGVNFPNKLIISNAYPESGDVLAMDITEKLPFDDRSLGCVISSCLPLVDLLNPLRDVKEIKVIVRELNLLAERVLDGDDSALEEFAHTKISPRISLINESSRVLEDGGLLIIKSLLDSELRIIDKLGFEEIASIDCGFGIEKGIWSQKEHAFRLSRENWSRFFGRAIIDQCGVSLK